MIRSSSGRHFSRLAHVLSIVVFFALTSCSESSVYPASEGFNAKGSDKKAIEIVDRMMEKLGGWEAWKNTRFLAWTYFGQYQIWDKQESLFRHEKGNIISIMNLNKRAGQVYINGVQETDSLKMYGHLSTAYTHFVANTYFLFMPYKMKDPGVTLLYRGEGQTMEGKPADIVRMIFNEVGLSPENMHDVWIDKETGLPAQWAFYTSREEKVPAFVRKWSDYKDYNGLKLATNRNSYTDTLSISHIVATDFVPKEVFLSPTPVDKTLVK